MWSDRGDQKSRNDLHTVYHVDSVHLPTSNYPRDPSLYVCFANLSPLTFPHDGVHVTTCLYTFYPSFRFTIQVTHGRVEHGVEGLLVVTRGATMVHTSKEGTDPFMMS